jgi:hypothetical protein
MSHYPLPWAVDALRSPSELEDVGWFVPEIALAPQPLRHRREVGSRNTNHRHLVFVKRQTTSSERRVVHRENAVDFGFDERENATSNRNQVGGEGTGGCTQPILTRCKPVGGSDGCFAHRVLALLFAGHLGGV